MKGFRPSRSNWMSPRTQPPISAAAMALREAVASAALARSVAAVPSDEIFRRTSAPSATLSPIPMTTQAEPEDSTRTSISTPPSLRSPTRRSFGHLSAAPATPASRSTRSAHTPMTRLSAPSSCGTSRKVQLRDRQIAPPGGANQARPRAAPAGRLVLRQHDLARAACGMGALQEPGVRGGDRPRGLDARHVIADVAREMLADRGCVESLAAVRQAVAPIAHRVQRRSELAQRPGRVPHGAAA